MKELKVKKKGFFFFILKYQSLSLDDSVKISTKNSKGITKPDAPRKKNDFCGIINQGATCYLNTLLQTLFLTPEFRGNFITK